jgi:tetratricopeptide (TPR) repeat protein
VRKIWLALAIAFPLLSAAQEEHHHGTPEKLGNISFPISCNSDSQPEFNRGVALLHSFAYAEAQKTFQAIAARDPHCAMAHWGIAMTGFHPLWEPALPPATISLAQKEIEQAQTIRAPTKLERALIDALALVYQNASTVPYRARVSKYEQAMSQLAAENRENVEAQVFYALALLANASPFDKRHTRQKQAVDLLEPLYRRFPQHPGIPHYLIHACDNAELASRGLAAARAYSQIAPSVPHALHMPSHIFTRLGLWDDSIASNLAAKNAAHEQHDIGEELHAMDYLVYAYLQSGRDAEAGGVVQQLANMPQLSENDFKSGYAATAMPVRYAVERHAWSEAANTIAPPDTAPGQVMAIAVWARGLGHARSGSALLASVETEKLRRIGEQLHADGQDYWASQVDIMRNEVLAWVAEANQKPEEAVALMRTAADAEDSIEKLPVTPGPIVPAREQLGELLLGQNHPALALKEFKQSLVAAPRRRGALQGVEKATGTSDGT